MDSPPFVKGLTVVTGVRLHETLSGDRVGRGLRPEHRARDGEEPVSDGAQGAAVSVTACAKGGVLVLAGGVMLDGDTSPG